jgi:hypothetical protein
MVLTLVKLLLFVAFGLTVAHPIVPPRIPLWVPLLLVILAGLIVQPWP